MSGHVLKDGHWQSEMVAATPALHRYVTTALRLNVVFAALPQLAQLIDGLTKQMAELAASSRQNALVAAERVRELAEHFPVVAALEADLAHLVEKISRSTDAEEPLAIVAPFIGEVQPELRDMVLVTQVNNFQTYLSELLTAVFTQQPKTLKSFGDDNTLRVNLDDLIANKSGHEILSSYTNEQVRKLAYSSLLKLHSHLKSKLGFELLRDGALEEVCALVEMRNLAVHNRSVVTSDSVSRFPAWEPFVGNTIHAEGFPVPDDPAAVLLEAACDIDERAISKWKLETETAATKVPMVFSPTST